MFKFSEKTFYKILIICFVFISFKPSESVRKQKLDTGLLALTHALQEGVPRAEGAEHDRGQRAAGQEMCLLEELSSESSR